MKHLLTIRSSTLCTLFLLILLLSGTNTFAQHELSGLVTDAFSQKPLPFATIKAGSTTQGTVTDLNGRYHLNIPDGVSFLEISYLGYENLKVPVPQLPELNIALTPAGGALREVVIKPPYEKIRRILNNAIAHRSENNPELYDWYRCHVYYKMLADVTFADSTMQQLQRDTSADARATADLLNTQHLLMSETYSIRTWRRPQQLQEEVLGSKFSGFKKNMFTSLVTDVLPFHAYSDYLTLNGKDYPNPVCPGYGLRYEFNLSDELMQGNDTLWILSFRPKKNVTGLHGTVYINSHNYAIAYLIAHAKDEQLKRSVSLEQEYRQEGNKWFPHHLNYIINWQQKSDSIRYNIYMKGTSLIDSVDFVPIPGFRFDKAHTVKLQGNADELSDTAWKQLRPVALDNKEQKTYKVIDSLMTSIHADAFMPYLDKLVDAKFPVGKFDIDLKRIYSYNKYEKSRWGLGLQTNEKLIRWMSVGGWAGYGFGDVHWKYGGFTEFYLDKYKEFTIRAAYDNDLRDPGHLLINRELDRNYLRRFLMYRVDAIESYSLSVKKRMGYLTAELTGRYESLTPKYDYALDYEGGHFSRFTATETTLGLRYAFAERSAPFFGRYLSTGTKYPVLYARITAGILESNNWNTNYVQTIGAIAWQKHFNRIGSERFLLTGGKSWSDKTLPLSKLFAANGFVTNNTAIYAFGGMQTIRPYEYYTDRFINFYWRHNFDRKLYTLESPYVSFSSAPTIGLAWNMLWGKLDNPEAQQAVNVSIPEPVYHETGVLLNNILRLRYLNLYYITLNAGYFYHWTDRFDADKNGRFVFGLGFEL